MDDEPSYDRILENIAACQDIDKLTTFVVNARKRKVMVVEDAALRQLKSLIPSHKKGSYEKAFWDMFLTYQKVLFEHGKPTVKLNKTWKTALSDGETKALTDWIENGNQIWALDYLSVKSPKSMTAEKLALKHVEIFETNIQAMATKNLQSSEVRILEAK